MDKETLDKLLDESLEQRQETAEALSEILQERYGEASPSLKVFGLMISTAIAEFATKAIAVRGYPGLSEVDPVEALPPGAVRRRRGRPRTFRDRQAFWDEVVQEFRRQVPRATVSGSRSQRVRSVRLGRGQQARLEWAFRRRRGFSVQLVLNGATPGENQARLQEMEGERKALERETDARLVFEAGRGRQARVAAHYRGSSRLSEAMRDWAVDRMARFYVAFRARLEEGAPS